MTNYVANKVAKHVLKETAENHFGSDDPYFEHVAAIDMNGRATGKYSKRKRAIPPGLTQQEEKILKKVTRRAHRLDNAFNVCGIRVGWSAVIGIIPAAGDIVDAMMAFMVVWTCTQAQIPPTLKSRMVMNIALDFAVGLVPLLGDVADAFFRCNTRNAALLWKHLQARGAARIQAEELAARGGATGGQTRAQQPLGSQQEPGRLQPSTGKPRRDDITAAPAPQPALPERAYMNEKSPAATTQDPTRFVAASDLASKRQGSKLHKDKGSGGGWLGRFVGSKGPERDVESGERAEMTQQQQR